LYSKRERWLHRHQLGEFALFILSGLLGAALTSAVVWAISSIPIWSGYELRDTIDQGEYFALAQHVPLHGAFSYGEPHRWERARRSTRPAPMSPRPRAPRSIR
jgi:hypothetical protein